MTLSVSTSHGAVPDLEVLISTIGREGIERVAGMQLPCVDGVRYLVSWQCADGELPDVLSRPDVKVVLSGSMGLSNNRNDAFAASESQLLLIADDDLRYTADGLRTVIDTMMAHPGVDLATFMHVGGDHKMFPEVEFDLRRPASGYYVTSFEIAVRRHVVAGDSGVRFDPRFGIGAPRFGAGEEQFFIDDVMSRGYECRFFPKVIVSHPGVTTSQRYLTPGVLMAQGVYLRTAFAWPQALARIPLLAWRHYRAQRYTLFPSIWYIAKGWRIGRRALTGDVTPMIR